MQRVELRRRGRIRAVGQCPGESTPLSQEVQTSCPETEHRTSRHRDPANRALTGHRVYRPLTDYLVRRPLTDYWVYRPPTDRVHRPASCPRMADRLQGSLDRQWTSLQVTKGRLQVGLRRSRVIPPVRQTMELATRGS